MNSKVINLLLVEDNPVDVLAVRNELSSLTGTLFVPSRAESLAEAVDILHNGAVDLVLLDLGLPDSSGLDTFLALQANAPDVPIIVMSGLDDEFLAVEAVRQGAQDYLVKGKCDGLSISRSAAYAIERQQLLVRLRNTERSLRQSEEVARRSARALRAISECNHSLIHATRESDFLNDVCRIIVEVGEYRMAWIGFALQDESRSVQPMALAGYEDGYLSAVEITWSTDPSGQGPTGTAIRTGTVQINRNSELNPDYGLWREDALKRGYAASVALPLVIDDHSMGALTIYSSDLTAFDAEELGLLEQLALDVSYGINGIRLRGQRDEFQQALMESEQQYRVLAENSQTGVFIHSVASDTYLYVNQRFADIIGYAIHEIIDTTPWLYIHPEDLQEVKRRSRLRLEGDLDVPSRDEVRIVRKDGNTRWVEMFVACAQYRGRPAQIGNVTDITELKEAEEALRHSEERFRAIFEGAQDAIYIQDCDLRLTHVNPATAKIFGPRTHELIGMHGENLFGPEAAKHVREINLRVLAGETVEEERMVQLAGTNRIFSTHTVPLRDASGTIVGLCGISRDVTERKRAELPSYEQNGEYPSPVMKRTLQVARVAAQKDSLILLLGESGSGKDYLARFIHDHSKRASGPYFTLNCAAIAPHLAESELFGHEKGAFTGAQGKKRGLLELAEGGTLLLNEIGELPIHLQAKLLTFLDTRKYTRVGGEREIPVSARLVVATNRNLEQEVEGGRFRKDLFFRINVFSITVPPLRERREDLPLLVQNLLGQLRRELRVPAPYVDSATMERLQSYDWPGNVRELRNVLERAIILSDGKTLNLAGLGLGQELSPVDQDWSFVTSFPKRRTLNDVTHDLKRSLVVEALRRSNGNKQAASRMLGISRYSLKHYLKHLGIADDD